MIPRGKLTPLLPILLCLLTAVASGDDFCLPRVLLTPDCPDTLPLDDPNTDFIEPGESGRVSPARQYTGDRTAPPESSRGALPLASAGLSPPGSFPPGRLPFCAGLTPPLRC